MSYEDVCAIDWKGYKAGKGAGKKGGRRKGKDKSKGKSETRYCFDCGEQGHIGVNCPYKWTHSMDEEDDQTSSRESELEGENAEELVSLSRVTRWGRRIDSRPAVHDLAEDDEGGQASGGLKHLVPRNAGGAQWTWKKVTVVVDSGAAQNVMPRSMFPEVSIRQTERSKNGKGFEGPGREHGRVGCV